MELTKFNKIIEHDINPLLIFDKEGKLVYLNKSAELLINSTIPKELYNLAISHASKSFGSKITHIDLSFKTYRFYAISVYYENEEEISLQLYHKPMPIKKKLPLNGYSPTDINLLLEANIELFNMEYDGKITLFTDYDLPKLFLNQNRFSQLLQKVFLLCKESNLIDISLTIKLGESIHINDKKYPILLLKIRSCKREKSSFDDIEHLAEKSYINFISNENELILEIPYIKID
jgi:nitrogen-specific signal transduction histidine kinase